MTGAPRPVAVNVWAGRAAALDAGGAAKPSQRAGPPACGRWQVRQPRSADLLCCRAARPATAHFKRPKVTMARVPVETNKTQAGPRAMSAWPLTLGFLGMAVPG